MIKKGDTLVEVTLAIGIFSMVAIAVVSVVNSSASGAQTSLETTLAREEIDAEAEALRFIHSSYISSKALDSADLAKYESIWRAITKRALTATQVAELNAIGNNVTVYSPSSCEELYDNDNSLIKSQNAFAIDTTKLSSSNVSNIVLSAQQDDIFRQTSTYPRILHGGDGNAIIDQDSGTGVAAAEGIYIVAVQDPISTPIVSPDSAIISNQSAYYDFYIRTCWYGAGSNRPSTISTLIRLYDPDIISTD